MDGYKSYYLKDLIPIIEHAALDLMSEPIVGGKKADGTMMTLQEVAHQNSLFAMNNAGIRLLAKVLIEQLSTGADPDG